MSNGCCNKKWRWKNIQSVYIKRKVIVRLIDTFSIFTILQKRTCIDFSMLGRNRKGTKVDSFMISHRSHQINVTLVFCVITHFHVSRENDQSRCKPTDQSFWVLIALQQIYLHHFLIIQQKSEKIKTFSDSSFLGELGKSMAYSFVVLYSFRYVFLDMLKQWQGENFR